MKDNAKTIHFATETEAEAIAKMIAFGTMKRLHAGNALKPLNTTAEVLDKRIGNGGNKRITELQRMLSIDIYFSDNSGKWYTRLSEAEAMRDCYNTLLPKYEKLIEEAIKDKRIDDAKRIKAEAEAMRIERNALTEEVQALYKRLEYAYSDAMDIYHSAYVYILQRIKEGAKIALDDNGNIVYDKPIMCYNAENAMIITDRYGNTYDYRLNSKRKFAVASIRSVFASACAKVRKYINDNRGILEGSANYTYLADMASADDNGNITSDSDVATAIYARSGKWYDMPDLCTMENQRDIIARLNLTATQALFVHYRLQGFSQADIARKMSISDSAINHHRQAVLKKFSKLFPEASKQYISDYKKYLHYLAIVNNPVMLPEAEAIKAEAETLCKLFPENGKYAFASNMEKAGKAVDFTAITEAEEKALASAKWQRNNGSGSGNNAVYNAEGENVVMLQYWKESKAEAEKAIKANMPCADYWKYQKDNAKKHLKALAK